MAAGAVDHLQAVLECPRRSVRVMSRPSEWSRPSRSIASTSTAKWVRHPSSSPKSSSRVVERAAAADRRARATPWVRLRRGRRDR
ncbi:MAG: hypothetical protein R2695_16925 [Acidimicrobiales bacterium]